MSMIKSSIFSPSSKLTHWLIGASTILATNFCLASASHAFTLTSSGTIAGSFNTINGLTVDTTGNVFVLDTEVMLGRVQKFDSTGTALPDFIDPNTSNPSSIFTTTGSKPSGIAVSGTGTNQRIFISDPTAVDMDSNPITPNVQIFDSTGNNLSNFGAFNNPNAIAVDSSGTNIFVADNNAGTSVIQQFGITGNSINSSFLSFNTNINGITVDGSGNIFVTGADNSIQKFAPNGTSIPLNFDGTISFNNPRGIAVDSDGYIYVADAGNQKVRVFDGTSGQSVFEINGVQSSSLAVNSTNKKLYFNNFNTVQIFDIDPTAVPFEFSPNLGVGALGIVVAAKKLHKKQQEKQKTK